MAASKVSLSWIVLILCSGLDGLPDLIAPALNASPGRILSVNSQLRRLCRICHVAKPRWYTLHKHSQRQQRGISRWTWQKGRQTRPLSPSTAVPKSYSPNMVIYWWATDRRWRERRRRRRSGGRGGNCQGAFCYRCMIKKEQLNSLWNEKRLFCCVFVCVTRTCVVLYCVVFGWGMRFHFCVCVYSNVPCIHH